jgi:hypothetical protein
MKPKTITLTGNGTGTSNSSPLRVNWRTETTSLSFKTSGNTTNFAVQYTVTPPDGYATAAAWASAAQWHTAYNGATPLSGLTAAATTTLIGPVHGIRLEANNAGADTGTLFVTQSDC